MRKLCPALVGLLLYLGASIPSAWAEPFRVQNGTLQGDQNAGGAVFNWNAGIPPDAFGGLELSSGEFTFSGSTFNPVIVQPGQEFTLAAIFSGDLAGEVGVPSAGGHDVDVRGTGDLHVTSGRLLAPAPFPGGADSGFIQLTTAFSMSGVLDVTFFEVSDGGSHPIGSSRNDVFGHGSAVVLLQPLFETGNYQVALLDGTFQPVPEPSTIVLLGLGGVILAARSTHRRVRRTNGCVETA